MYFLLQLGQHMLARPESDNPKNEPFYTRKGLDWSQPRAWTNSENYLIRRGPTTRPSGPYQPHHRSTLSTSHSNACTFGPRGFFFCPGRPTLIYSQAELLLINLFGPSCPLAVPVA